MAPRGSEPMNDLLENLVETQSDPESFNGVLALDVQETISNYSFTPAIALKLLALGLRLIKTHPDVKALSRLILILIHAIESVSFDDLAPVPVEAVIEGLDSTAEEVQNLGLAYIEKAAESPSGAATIANNDLLVQSLIKLCLTSPSTDTGATQGLHALVELLKVDSPGTTTVISDGESTGPASGQGLLWRRIFHDEGVYQLLFTCTSSEMNSANMSLTAKSIAQSRLSELVLKMAALRWDPLVDQALHQKKTSQIQSKRNCGKSLLDYTIAVMIDWSDQLMMLNSVVFAYQLLKVKEPLDCKSLSSIPMSSSPSLEFLISSGVHERLIKHYLASQNSEIEASIGYSRSDYLRYYLQLYPEHFIRATALKEAILTKLCREFPSSGSGRVITKDDFNSIAVMASIPATVYMVLGADRCSILHLPASPANALVFFTLATVFHGPSGQRPDSDRGQIGGTHTGSQESSAFASRAVFFRYITTNPQFWANIAGPMNVVAMPDEGVAAFELLRAILTAHWAELPDESPLESRLTALWGQKAPASGVRAVIEFGLIVLDSLVGHYNYTSRVDQESNQRVQRLERAQEAAGNQMLDLMKKGVGREGCDKHMWRSTLERLQRRFANPQNRGRNGALVDVIGA